MIVNSRNNTGSFITVLFRNIQGIDILSNPLQKNNFISDNINLEFKKVDLEFYANKKLIKRNTCNRSLFFEISDNMITVWSSSFFTNTSFLKFNSVKFPQETCPFTFQHSKIGTLDTLCRSSFIKTNVLSFIHLPGSMGKYIDSSILQFILNMYHVRLDSSLLDEYVFKELLVLDLNGQISSIQSDLFKSFEKLKMLRIKTQNAKGILTHNNKWIQSLNSDVQVDLNNRLDMRNNMNRLFFLIIFQTYSNVTYYDFPDEDFCFFNDFPHQKLIVPFLRPTFKSSCSCTELFLIKHSFNLESEIFFYTDQTLSDYYFLNQYYSSEINERTYSRCVNSSLKMAFFQCDFLNRLRKCKFNTTNTNRDVGSRSDETVWYMADWLELSNYSEYAFLIYINPIMSFVCIFINGLMIGVLLNKIIDKTMRNAYNYLVVHCSANIILIILLLVNLFTACITEELFCSSLINTDFARYYSKIFVNVIKKALQTFANISYFWFILFRYINVKNPKNRFLGRLKTISSIKIFLVTILVSLLINLFAYFEHNASTRGITVELEVKILDPKDNFKTNLSQTEYFIFNVFQYVKIIFSDLFFLILITIIDMALAIFISKNISNSTTVNVSKRALRKKKTSKKRITTMVILNGFNFLFLRLPSALMDLYGLIFIYDANDVNKFKPNTASYIVCRVFLFCASLQEVFYLFYLLSFLFQFFIFFKLDKNFKESFVDIKSRFVRFFRR